MYTYLQLSQSAGIFAQHMPVMPAAMNREVNDVQHELLEDAPESYKV